MFTRREDQPGTAHRAASTGTSSSSGATGYMAELEKWLDECVFEPIERAVATSDVKELHIAFRGWFQQSGEKSHRLFFINSLKLSEE